MQSKFLKKESDVASFVATLFPRVLSYPTTVGERTWECHTIVLPKQEGGGRSSV